MTKTPLTCDPAWIDLFLQQQLTEPEQSDFERHLDDCADCRHRLEAAAGSADVWSDVRESLREAWLPPGERERPPSNRTRKFADDSAAADCARGEDAVDDADGDSDSVAERPPAEFAMATVMSHLAPADDERMLGRLGPYEVTGVVGSSAMGVVLKALDPALNRYVAIKVLAPHLADSGAARKRFSREAQAAAAVVHENVMEIYGVSDNEGLPRLVMPYVRGPSLQRRLDDEGPLETAEILRIGMQAARGLAAAHAQGLVHRDVKPANILLADGIERVKLTDFGLARAADDASLTRTGIIAGTPQYMSPEQARGDSVGQRSDLFSLGCVLYAMCTGYAPFRAETSYGVLRRVTDEAPRPVRDINPRIPDWLCRIVDRLMAKSPDDRFASAREVAELLEQCLAHVQQPDAVPLPSMLTTSATRRLPAALRTVLRSPRRAVMWILPTAAALLLAGWQLITPPDISGVWTGPDWGTVRLETAKSEAESGQYTGRFETPDAQRSGALALQWSRLQRRFVGSWNQTDGSGGRISLRRVDDTLRGAWTTETSGRGASELPPLADLTWVRADSTQAVAGESPAGAAAPGTTERHDSASQRNAASPEEPPRRLRRIPGLTRGNNIFVACSADGTRIAAAGWNPTRTMRVDRTSRVKGGWNAEVTLIAAGSGETLATLPLLTPDESAVVDATPQVSHVAARALAFSPNGTLLAVGTNVGQIRLYEVATGELLRTFDDSTARLADTKSPELWKSLPRAMGRVESLRFSPDGSRLIACGESFTDFADTLLAERHLGFRETGPGRVKLWDVASGELLHDLVGHNNHAFDVAYAPDGNRLASAGRWHRSSEPFGNGVIVWNARTGRAIHYLIRSTADAGVRAITFSPDSRHLVLGTQRFGDGDGSTGGVSLVNASSGVTEWLVTVPGWARPLAFTQDGEWILVLCGGRSIRFLDPANGHTSHEIRAADESSDEAPWKDFASASRANLLVIGSVDKDSGGTVEIWSTGASPPPLPPAAEAAESPDDPPETYSPDESPSDRNAMPEFDPGMPVQNVAGSRDGSVIAVTNARAMVFGMSPFSGDTAANASEVPSTVRVLDAQTGDVMSTLSLDFRQRDQQPEDASGQQSVRVAAIAVSPDGQQVCVGTHGGQLGVFSARTGALLRLLDDSGARPAAGDPESPDSQTRVLGTVAAIEFSPDGELLAVCGESFDDVADRDRRAEHGYQPVTGLGRIKLWNPKSGQRMADLNGHSQVHALAFSPDGRRLATAGSWLAAGEAGTGIIVHELPGGRVLRRVVIASTRPFFDIAFSPDGDRLAVSSFEGSSGDSGDHRKGVITVVRTDSGIVDWARSFPGPVSALAFHSEGPCVAALNDNGLILFRLLSTGETLWGLRHSAGKSGGRWTDIVSVKSGRMLVMGGKDGAGNGTLNILDLDRF